MGTKKNFNFLFAEGGDKGELSIRLIRLQPRGPTKSRGPSGSGAHLDP